MNNQLNYFSPSNFTRPNSEVNWAQLAQRWIYSHQMQQQQQAFILPPPGPYLHQPGSYPIPPSLPPQVSSHMPYQQPERPMQYLQQPFPHPPHLNQWRQPWQAPHPNIRFPPPRYPLCALTSPSQSYPTNLQNQVNDDEEYQAHYDPSLDQDDNSEGFQHQNHSESDSTNLPDGAMGHWMTDQSWSSSNFMPVIDMQMRKKLPYWILEGLEKAEKERKKKLEKEQLEKRKKEEEEEKRKKREEKGLGKFDSDSEDDEDINDIGKNQNGKSSVLPEKRQFREFVQYAEDTRTEEELKEEAIALMRSLITSVLLSVTNQEIERIVNEQFQKARNKAQPKLLAKSPALAALTSLFDDEGDGSGTDGEELANKELVNKKIKLEQSEEQPSKQSFEGLVKAEKHSMVFKVPLAPQPRSAKIDINQETKTELSDVEKSRDHTKFKNEIEEKPTKVREEKDEKRERHRESKRDSDRDKEQNRKSRRSSRDRDRSRSRERKRKRSRERRYRSRSPRDRERYQRSERERERYNRDHYQRSRDRSSRC